MIEVDAMFPVMVTSDLEVVKQFYETVFGFKAVFYDSNFYLHLVSPNNNIQLGFLVPNVASQPEFLHPIMSAKGYVISLEVKDAALAYAEAKQMDLNFIMALKEEEWGQVHFMIQDPAGLSIDVVQHL
ncbi:glyoxalase [Photobacterium sp. GB-50]|uniref:VOC family protein n=1 Tax=Photobacterium sp. GB-50 TaxID=2022107 RepID=UPI000D16755F|nr:VOC family protein [Photobacterium sp. GB-50]PSW73227.1 glyoxalase [Photobacterium sp. GB-50]